MESSKYADAVQLAVSPVDVRLVFTTSEPIIIITQVKLLAANALMCQE